MSFIEMMFETVKNDEVNSEDETKQEAFDQMIKEYCQSFFHIKEYPKTKMIANVKGKTDGTQFSYDNNEIQIMRSHTVAKEKRIKWLVHEIGHWIFFNKYSEAKAYEGGDYPYNYIERYAYSCQFKKIQEDGNKNFEQILKLCKPNGYEDVRNILKVYWNNPDKYINDPFADLPIKETNEESLQMSFKDFLNEQDNKEDDDQAMGAIIEYFSTHENPTDKDIHAIANQLGYKEGGDKTVHDFEAKIYSLLSSFFNAGKSKGKSLEDINPDQLKKGIKVEMEHTNIEPIARKIAIDHLTELDDYYDRLEKMENNK